MLNLRVRQENVRGIPMWHVRRCETEDIHPRVFYELMPRHLIVVGISPIMSRKASFSVLNYCERLYPFYPRTLCCTSIEAQPACKAYPTRNPFRVKHTFTIYNLLHRANCGYANVPFVSCSLVLSLSSERTICYSVTFGMN